MAACEAVRRVTPRARASSARVRGPSPPISCHIADACDEATKGCTHTPDSAMCGDSTFCNGAEVCDAVMGCIAGIALLVVGVKKRKKYRAEHGGASDSPSAMLLPALGRGSAGLAVSGSFSAADLEPGVMSKKLQGQTLPAVSGRFAFTEVPVLDK